MGRRSCPTGTANRPMRPVQAALRRFLAFVALICAVPVPSATAQTLADKVSARTQNAASGPDRLLVQANEMVYDRDGNTVSARGSVKLYYQGRVLEADRVTYNRTTNRVAAEGRAKLTERDGTVAYANRFDITDDFKTGFIDSLRADSADKTHFTSTRAERVDGETTVLENGTYTACEPCKDDPSKPPLWQVKAKRIIHQNSEQMVYYEDATIELAGMPIAWLPYLSVADPSVTRKSGLLTPSYSANLSRGVGVSMPLFWAISPDRDLTVTPTLFTRQGLLGQAQWRQQLATGAYDIRVSGIFQNDPGVFSVGPYGPGNRTLRGAIESKGDFQINDKWKYGWDLAFISDRWFYNDYRIVPQTISSNYFKESISQLYLTGQGERGYFDLRGYYFKGLSSYDIQAQQPIVGPVLDYNKAISLAPEKSGGLGGQVEIDFNLTHLTRQLAAFEATGLRKLDNAYGLYDVCTPAASGLYTPSNCLLRGIGGDYTRATLNLSWKRQFIDPIGQVWTPFTFAHVNGSWLSLNTTNSTTISNPGCGTPPCFSTISNASQPGFIGSQNDTFVGQAIPGAGLEYRYPFLSSTSLVNQVFEPIAQVVVRPGNAQTRALVNEDSQSLVFDDTNLFDWSKFSGYDRFETGTRFNYGFQYTATFKNGAYANFMAGQSFQVAGKNAYATPDAANIGLSSGLDTRRSDFVARAAFSPNSTFNFVAKGRFDEHSFAMRRLDLMGTANIGAFEFGLQYAHYQAQPLLGYDLRREGLSASTKLKLTENTFINGNVIFDMSRHLYNQQFNAHAPLFSLAGIGVGGGYQDDCISFQATFTSIYQDNGYGTSPIRNQTVMQQLQLRTLGDTKVKSNLGDVRVSDGLSNSIVR